MFGKHDTDDLNRKSASDILEKLRPIRQGINKEFIAKRLVWELIQNAKDNVALCNKNSDNSLRIEVQITEDQFIFSHNKGFFRNENIRGLIRRYSSSDKDRDEIGSDEKPPATGRFGTGFMTTHLLSEIVDVEGAFEINATSFKNVKFRIDRSGTTKSELIKSIENAFKSAEQSIGASNLIDDKREKFNTRFIYHLNEEGYKLAKISIEELKNTVAYSLISHPQISEIIYTIGGETSFFSVKKVATHNIEESELSIFELTTGNSTPFKHYVSVSKGKTRIMLPVSWQEDSFTLLPLGNEVPRLFLDFPLLGTEELNIPFVVNSPSFEPTEQRDGISLTGGVDHDTVKNDKILKEAFELFNSFINFIEDKKEWKNLFELARFRKPKEKDWINQEWYSKEFLKPIRSTLFVKRLVETQSGLRKSIKNAENDDEIYFPSASDDEVRNRIWELSKDLFPDKLPKLEHIHEWDKIIWKGCYKQTIEELTKDIEKAEGLSGLAEKLDKSSDEIIDWLNEYYDLVNLEDHFIDRIIKDEFKVIPNQNGKFKERTSLFIDNYIEEELKNVFNILGVDLRDSLLNIRVNTASKYKSEKQGQILYFSKSQENVIEELNKHLKEKNDTKGACNYLTACFSEEPSNERNKIYQFCTALWEMPERKLLKYSHPDIWKEVNKVQIKRIVKTISAAQNIDNLQGILNSDKAETLSWLASVIDFLNDSGYQDQLNLKSSPILPNQKGDFCMKDNLFLDDGEIDEVLKNIADNFGCSVRNELLDTAVHLELPDNRVKTQPQVAEEITKKIKPILKDPVERDNYKNEIRTLYLWMNKNTELAKDIFSEIYEKRFLLVSDEEIVANFEMAEIMGEVCQESGLSPSEVKSKLKELLTGNNTEKEDDSTSPANGLTNSNVTALLDELGYDSLDTLKEEFLYYKELVEFQNEDNVSYSDSQHASNAVKHEHNKEAFEKVSTVLKREGYEFTKDYAGSVVDGVFKDGVEYPLVIKSFKNNGYKFNITPGEWVQLSKPNAIFLVYRGGENIVRLTLEGLLSANRTFHMHFLTSVFRDVSELAKFAAAFTYVKGVRFQADAPMFMQIESFNKLKFDERDEMQKAIEEDKSIL